MKNKKTLTIFALFMVALLGIGLVSAFGGSLKNKALSEEDRESMKLAIEQGDYESWAEMKRSQISEERFKEIQERHKERNEFRLLMEEARESGDYSKIQELKSEFGKGKGMHKQNKNSGECPFN